MKTTGTFVPHVQLWDVGCQRQVEIAGPQAKAFVQRLTPRDLGALRYGQALYVPLTDERGGMVNDPVLLKSNPIAFGSPSRTPMCCCGLKALL